MTVRKLRELVAGYGGSVDEQSYRNGAIVIDAPTGFRWRASNTHAMREEYENNGGQGWLREAVKEMAVRVSMGLNRCDDQECDVCHE